MLVERMTWLFRFHQIVGAGETLACNMPTVIAVLQWQSCWLMLLLNGAGALLILS